MTSNNKSAEELFHELRTIVAEAQTLSPVAYLDAMCKLIGSVYFMGKSDALRWIPITERLPANGQKVALLMAYPFDGDGQVYTAEMRGNKFYNICDEEDEEPNAVTDFEYWLPLPPPPEPKV